MFKRMIYLVFVMVLFVVASSLRPPAVASAATDCDTGFGGRVPVLMVHGYASGPRMWTDGSPSMEKVLEAIPGAYVAQAFDYQAAHYAWVTNPAIGPKLAVTIDCLARASREGGGAGKVIVIAHSMGGLAARYAANQVIDGRRVADELGLVVTLGTPHQGSLWGNAGTSVATSFCEGTVGNLTFNPLLGILMSKDECLGNLAMKGLSHNSKELQALPPFPSSVPVRAIAGDTRIYVQLLFTEFAKTGTTSDLVVGVNSATAEATNTGRGDGVFVFRCDVRRYASNGIFQGGQCSHNEMYQTGYVQDSVRNAITDYQRSVQAPHQSYGQSVTLFHKLTLTYPTTWRETTQEKDAVEAFDDLTHCDANSIECPSILFVNLDASYSRQAYGQNPVATAAATCYGEQDEAGHRPYELPQLRGKVSIGQEGADYYEQSVCPPYLPKQMAYMWYVPRQNVLVVAEDTQEQAVDLDTLRRVLEDATWS